MSLATGAPVKTGLLFFTKGRPTRQTWYYSLKAVNPMMKIGQEGCSRQELLAAIQANHQQVAGVLRALHYETDGG